MTGWIPDHNATQDTQTGEWCCAMHGIEALELMAALFKADCPSYEESWEDDLWANAYAFLARHNKEPH